MNIVQDIAVTLGAAVLTALIAAPFVGPEAARAKDAKVDLAPVTAASKLTADGMTLSMRLKKEKYEPGEKPGLVLTAVGGAKGASGDVVVRMRSRAPASRMSRMMPMPREVWTESISIKLKPGETRTVELAPGQAVAAGSAASFEIQLGEKRLAVPGYSLAVPLLKFADVREISLPARAMSLRGPDPQVVEIVKAIPAEDTK